LRYFFDTVGVEHFEGLCCLVGDLVLKAGLAPLRSTYPGDPPDRGVTISHDIMLHDAYSKMAVARFRRVATSRRRGHARSDRRARMAATAARMPAESAASAPHATTRRRA
jgi:hypothetical protein